MNFRIRYNREKIKELVSYLHKAYELGDIHIVKRVSAMLRIHEGQSISYISQTLGVSLQAVYNWLKAFLLNGYDSFKFNYSPRRRPKLSKTQKLELEQCLLLSPTEYGYDTGCWNTLIITDLIYRK
jgi:transposase